MEPADERARQTTRQQLMNLLLRREHTALELSAVLRIPQKEVYDHLIHIRRSVVAQRMKFQIQPAKCLLCNYVFRKRQRLTTPGRCPRCRGEHIQDLKYRIAQPPPGDDGGTA